MANMLKKEQIDSLMHLEIPLSAKVNRAIVETIGCQHEIQHMIGSDVYRELLDKHAILDPVDMFGRKIEIGQLVIRTRKCDGDMEPAIVCGVDPYTVQGITLYRLKGDKFGYVPTYSKYCHIDLEAYVKAYSMQRHSLEPTTQKVSIKRGYGQIVVMDKATLAYANDKVDSTQTYMQHATLGE